VLESPDAVAEIISHLQIIAIVRDLNLAFRLRAASRESAHTR
jgi:hypothetical protein